ncbi:MAG: alpha/beta fold hydrolase [Bacteroidia bacterium]|nr:alpha/beta fold hydrolase [Bacteroidia bacterium]
MKGLVGVLVFILFLYLAICAIMYVFQERLLFFPEKLAKNYDFHGTYYSDFEELFIPVEEGISINGLLFKSPEDKGLVFFLHGNAGALNSWGTGADLYLDQGYDVFYLDYRGYGKSEGEIKSEKQFVEDAQKAYDLMKERYAEDQIILSGTSIGSGIATQLAARNHPKYLVLTSPYQGLQELIQEKYPFIPSFLIKYKLQSHSYLSQINCPISIFHGKQDKLIPSRHGEKLAALDKKVELHIIDGYGHNDLLISPEYQREMQGILN